VFLKAATLVTDRRSTGSWFSVTKT